MIFTDRIITVRKGESKINDPIVIYRGDYELGVRFTIMNSKFKFMSGTNLIESEEAAYGQLAILTPYGGNIFSGITRCSEGTVSFLISKEMIDQIEEVGLYSFQIRLFDYNQESRVSIPPIEFGIEIREPITSEDHDNSVNNAIVGYSIAKVVDPKEEKVGPTFDDNGNYNKTVWETGDRISQGKLNKMEDALDTINKNEKADIAALDKRVTSNFNVLTNEIDDKVGRDDKIPVTQLDKNSGKLDQSYLSEDLIKQIAGDAAVNAVPADNSITTNKIVDDAVTGEKVNFVDVSLNMINPDKLVVGFINRGDGQILESVGTQTAYMTTDYMPIRAGVTYYTYGYRKLLCYDLNKNPIASTYETNDGPTGFKTFNQDGYVRITYYKEYVYTHAIFAESDVAVEFRPYGYTFNDKMNKIDADMIGSVDGESIKTDSIPSDKLKMISSGINLYNKDTVVLGFLSESYGTISNNGTATTYVTSDFIPVEPGVTYEVSEHRKLCVYNHNFVYRRGYDVELSKGTLQYTMEENDAYIRVSTTETRNSKTMVSKDKLPAEYTPYGNIINASGDLVGIDGEIMLGGTIPKEATDFIKMANYFNPYDENITEDALPNGQGIIAWNQPGVYDASGFIDIPITGSYVFYNVRHIWVYNTNGATLRSNLECAQGRQYVEELNKGQKVRIALWHQLRYTSTIIQYGTSIDFKRSVYGYVLDPSISAIVDSDDIVSLDGQKIHQKSISPEACSFIQIGKNLYNKDDVVEDVYLQYDGSYGAFAGYRTSSFIPVKANTDYHISKCRKFCAYDIGKSCKQELFVDHNNTALDFNLPFDGFIRISAPEGYWETVQIEQGTVETEFEPYGFTMPLLLNSGSFTPSTESVNTPHVINLSNVDRIAAIGDSYTESHYTIKGKAYLCKLSLFSDYNWENHAQSGDTYRGNLNRIRNNQAIYNSVWTDYKPTYALMISYTNDLKYMDVEQYKNDLRATIETVKGLGAIPILSTEYHTNFGSGIENAIFGVANEYGLDVINILPKATVLRGSKDYAPFWGGSHPGTRTNHVLSDPLDNYFKRMPRPFQSIKIFRVREATPVNSLDDLIVNTNLERAEKFKEIMIGHSALVRPEEYDACSSSSNAKVNSEYTTIMKKGSGVSFNKYALIDVVLPAIARDIDSIELGIATSKSVKAYIKNVVATPFAAPTFYQRFDYDGDYDIRVGDTYTSSRFGTQVFTVKEVSESGGIKSILTTPTMRASGEDGVLTKVSGSGAASINYYYTALGFASDYPVGKQNVGHWQEVVGANGIFKIQQGELHKCMDYDKLSVLLVCDGSFDLKDVQVVMNGKITKARPTLERHHIDLGTLPSNTKQLLSAELTGTSSELTKWTKSGSISAYTPADGIVPKGCSGCIDVTTSKYISQAFNYTTFPTDSKRALVRVWARYFPPIFNKDTMTYPDDSIITEDSFDYAKLRLTTTISGKNFEMSDIVGLGWKEVEFEIFLPNQAQTMTIKIDSLDKDIQIAKVSVFEL